MAKFGMLNGRMKDFCDIWMLSHQFDFNGIELAQAIRLTFEQRGTLLPTDIEAITESFIDNKQQPWYAFRNRFRQAHIPASFAEITAPLDQFQSLVIAAPASGNPDQTLWIAPGPWTKPASTH